MRYISHIKTFIHWRCTVQCFFIYSQLWNYHNVTLEHFQHPKKTIYYWLKSQIQWSSLITYRFSFRRGANDFCLVKKVAPKLMFLLSCRHLASFVSNLAVLVQYSFSNANAYTFNSPLNQLYHHADSLIDELVKSVTCFHCIFVWESCFKVFETYIWQSECS